MATQGTTDEHRLASGSTISLMGIVTDRGLRWVVNWFLSGTLGKELYGVYAFITKALSQLIAAFAVIGLDTGMVYFGSRFQTRGDWARLKGLLISGAAIASGGGMVAGLALTVGATGIWPEDPTTASAARWGGIIVALWSPLLFIVGTLRAVKDMRSSAMAYQITVPLALLLGVLVSTGFGWGIWGVLAAYTTALMAGLVAAIRMAWPHYKAILTNNQITPHFEMRKLLAFSVPQSLAAMVFRLNLRMDYLMLMWLSTSGEVGIYDIAAGLAILGALPVNAVITMLNPLIAELIESKEIQRLNHLVKTATRWLIMLAIPPYMVLMLLPDIILSVYDPVYMQSAAPLLILCGGQIIAVACAPTMRLIPMSGHSMLNLANGVVAAIVNITLNFLLIPEFGVVGAAIATSITLASWGLWRVAEVWWLLRCFPFTLKTGGVLCLSIAGVALVATICSDSSTLVRVVSTGMLLVGYLWVARLLITSQDRQFIAQMTKRSTST